MKSKLSLNEATIRELYNDLDYKSNDLEGLMDGVLVITDPNIDTEEYQELIDRAKEVIEDTPEGELPFDADYVGQYVQVCPICGTTFVEDHILEPGSTCPICFEVPEAFTLLGQIQGDKDAIASETDGVLDSDEGEKEEEPYTGFAKSLEDDVDNEKEDEDEANEEDNKLEASEQIKESDSKLTEDRKEDDFVRGEDAKKEIDDMISRTHDRESKVGIEEEKPNLHGFGNFYKESKNK